jgi:hypothetical protein
MPENKFPTEVIELPSQGHFYPEENALSSGKLEVRYMTAREEDILTSTNLIKKGLAIDMVLKSVVVTPIDYESMLIGDKNALMIATRILGYGKDYPVEITCPNCETKSKVTIDLSQLQHKEVGVDKFPKGVNEFGFELPLSKKQIKFKFLNGRDESEISTEMKAMKKISASPEVGTELSSRLKHVIVEVDGKRDQKTINDFIDKAMYAGDSLALRRYMNDIQPDVDLSFDFECSNKSECGYSETMRVPLTVEFFWPAGRG